MKLPWRKEKRADEGTVVVSSETLLSILTDGNHITPEQALEIPAVSGCISLIAETISQIPIKLYQKTANGSTEISEDKRVKMLNFDTSGTMTASEMWKAVIADYFLDKGAYVYIDRSLDYIDVQSLRYVRSSDISILHNTDPIFRKYVLLVEGKQYFSHQFLKVLRNTQNGYQGVPITVQNSRILNLAYATIKFEQLMMDNGGNKKGFLQSNHKLSQDQLNALNTAWKNLYTSDNQNLMVLNDGITFQESSNTSVEMQLNSNKRTNNLEICKLFHVPENMLAGSASSEDSRMFMRNAVLPILKEIEDSINRDLLLESEKHDKYFAHDITAVSKESIKERYEAYKTGIDSHVLQIDEARKLENLPPLGFNWLPFNLADVMWNPETGEFYVPNTGSTVQINQAKQLQKGGTNED